MEEIPGIAPGPVADFFAEHVPGGDTPLAYELIAGGRSNLTYRVHGDGQEWVLRRPPLGHVLPTAHDMAREFRVLSGLRDTRVPVPRAIALCEDAQVNGAPFYVMQYCPGVVVHHELPEGFAQTEEARRRIAFSMIDTLVELHDVDFEAVGLGAFGRPEGFLARQVKRWSKQWESSKTRELPAIDALIELLRRRLPESPPPTIVHGDFRLGNMALAQDSPHEIVAIFDWEMATLGDPLTDLGYTLMYWSEPGDPPNPLVHAKGEPYTTKPGFPGREELVRHYAKKSGRDLEAIAFYQALAFYKLAVIAEGIYARFLKGKTVGEGFDDGGRSAEVLVERGLALAEQL